MCRDFQSAGVRSSRVQLGDFVLAYQGALLSLAQLHLQLLHLAFVAASQFLLALLLDRIAVVLQVRHECAGVFPRSERIMLVLVSAGAVRNRPAPGFMPGIAGLFTPAAWRGALQGLGFLGQCQALQLVVLVQFVVGLPCACRAVFPAPLMRCSSYCVQKPVDKRAFSLSLSVERADE